MWIRRALFSWLFPAALVLPLWLLIGWGVFQSGGWAFLWVLFIAMPSVLIGEVLIALLVRARGTVRASRAVSWQDVAGIVLWHGLTIAVGFFPGAFGWILAGATAAFLVLFWSTLWQLWRESAAGLQRAMDPDLHSAGMAGPAMDPGVRSQPSAGAHGPVIVITETPAASEGTAR